MAFYQTILADRIVGAVGTTSPGTGWTTVTNFPTLVTNARSANLPLYLRPGTYATTTVNVTTSTGGGNPLRMYAPSGATVQLSGDAPNLIKVDGVNGVTLEGVSFSGGSYANTDTNAWPGLLRFNGDIKFTISKCKIFSWSKSGISATAGAAGTVIDCQFWSLEYGVTVLDSQCTIERNSIIDCTNGGVYVWTSSAYNIIARVADNFIQDIQNAAGGSGQYGNGISVYRAGGVAIVNNTIYQCTLSAIRINGGSHCQVLGNKTWSTGDVSIFVESPGSDVQTIGNIVANNVVDSGNVGITSVNVGLYGDGMTRRTIISGNQVFNSTNTAIVVEGGCVVTGNTIENGQIGIQVGTNDASFELDVTGNFVQNCNMAIGYSADGAAAGMLISSNVIKGYRVSTNPTDPNYAKSGAIVASTYDGSTTYRTANGSSPNTDYGNAAQTKIGGLTVGMNTARV